MLKLKPGDFDGSCEDSDRVWRLARMCCCQAIGNIASDGNDDLRNILIAAGATDALLPLTTAGSASDVRAAAADAIASMALDAGVGARLLRIRSSSTLFAMATHEGDEKVWRTASTALANMASEAYIQKRLVSTAGISLFARIPRSELNIILAKRYAAADADGLESMPAGSRK